MRTKFKDWMKESCMSMGNLALLARLSKATVRNVILGNPCHERTVKKLLKATKHMKPPITREMLKKNENH